MTMRLAFTFTVLAACATSDDVEVEEERPQLVIDCSQPPAACTQHVDGVRTTFDSVTEVRQLVTGVWLSCDPPPARYRGVGIELRKSKQFSILVPDGAGHCVRGTGPTYEGTWWVEDISEQNPKGTYQISLVWNDGASAGHVVTLAASPKWMHDTGPIGGTWVGR